MKKLYSPHLTLYYLFLMLIICAFTGNAQVIKPFKARTSSYSPTTSIYKIKGNFTMLGNTNLTLQNYDDRETNGHNPMIYVDVDSDNQTLNSSSATLDLLSDSGTKLTNCYNIVYAGLYWTGRVSDAAVSPESFDVTKNGITKTLNKRKILFKGPSASSYDEFTANDIYFPTNADNNMYTAYAEVTDYVRANGVGEYFAANIAVQEGADGGDIGKYAGWGLVVVYENSDMKNRDITVFDGHAFVSNNQTLNYEFPVSGFNSVTSGAVGVKLGVMAGEGDINYEGDYFQIEKLNSDTFLYLDHVGNATNNFFNSSIQTGGNLRNPALLNNSGIDISMFDLPNINKDIIGNNQTSTRFRYGSTVDSYTIFSIVMAVDAYVPDIEGTISATTINGSTAGAGPYNVEPGQSLGYKVQLKNKGTEPVLNSKIVVPIPYNATFEAGSLVGTLGFTPDPSPNSLTYEPTLGANGSIVWNIGTLPVSANHEAVLAELTFNLKATENCALLKNSNCNNIIQVNGSLSGTGENSQVVFDNKNLILGYTTSGNCMGNSIAAPLQATIDTTHYVDANCQATPPVIAFTFCNGAASVPITDITGSFPSGATFYDSYPIVAGTTKQYDVNNPFPSTVGTSTYYAIPSGATTGCYFQFTITIESITTTPETSTPINYCVGEPAVALTATPTKPEYVLYYYETANSVGQQTFTPSTTTVGQYTYYVAEGKSSVCIGPKKEIIVNVNAMPTVSITNPLPICAPATSLDLTESAITLNSTAGLTYTYWTDSAATILYPDFETAIPGTYYIKGTNPVTNCYNIMPVIVTKSTVLLTEVTASHIDVTCFGQSTGSITINNASGGVAPYTYSWKKNNAIYTGTSQTLTDLGAGTYEATATDANGCSGSATIIILEPNAALALAVSSKTDVSCYGESTGTITAGAVTNAVGALIYSWKNSANVEIGTLPSISNLPAGTYTLTVTDSCSSQSNSVTIDHPASALTATKSQTNASCGGTATGSATVEISGGTAPYTYSWNTTPEQTSATANNLPAGNYTVTITDAKGCILNESFEIIDGDAVKPIINPLPETLTINCPAQPVFEQATATDDSGSVASLTYEDVITAGSCAGSYTVVRTWKATDSCGNISLPVSQTIIVQDTTAPTWLTPINSLNAKIECSDTQALASAQALFPIAADTCDSDVSNILKVNGQFIASAGCSNAGTFTNTWTVQDDCGNISSTFTQVITLEDTTAPTFSGVLPTDVTVSCDAVPEPATLEATDNCNGNLPIVFTEVKSDIQNGCATNYTLTRKWTTSDCGGNTTSHTQIITVRDTTPPTGTAPADVHNLASITAIPAGTAQDITDAKDNCSATVDITVSDSNNGGTGCDGNAYILTRTYTLTDCAGNKTELVQTFTVENKISVSGIVTNVTCFGGSDGSILVTNSAGSTVIIRNENNQIVGNNNLPAGTYTLTASSAVNENQTCAATATVIITQPTYTVKISGQVLNIDSNTPIANVPVTLVPQGTTQGPILLRVTGADGMYSFSGMVAGSYLVQVQDANLNSAYQLYPVDTSLFFTTLEDCKIQQHNFEYGKSTLPVLGDYVWYDTNGNGVQDEWYDANNDGIVTKNIPDSEGAIDYSQWEWIDFNGDNSYTGPLNVGELNAGGFGNASSPNVFIDGPNGYHEEVIVGIEGFWRNRPETQNPYGQYTIKFVRDANLDAVAAALGATGLVKVLPSSNNDKKGLTNKTQLHTVCQTTSNSQYIVNITADDLTHLDLDFGVNCKVLKDIIANDDNAGPIASANQTTTNVLNVLPNDTIEGIVVTPSDVIISTITPNPYLQLNSDGSVDVLPNAPVGTLTLVYQICEADQTSNCDTATVTIIISEPAAPPTPVDAVDDTYTNIGCNTFGLVGNILSNDKIGTTAATLELVNLTLLEETNTLKTDPNITIDASGNVTVSSATPAGTYTYTYRICDKLNSENCDTATVSITVVPNGVTNITSEACNDDRSLIDLLTVLPANTPITGTWVDIDGSNALQGNILNPFGVALGNYKFEYRIADATCPRTILLTMEINDDCKVAACESILVHNAFSPNGDGFNDLFTIDNIDQTTCYPENTVEIYNRWGVLVFKTTNYNNLTNAFDGTSRGRSTVKEADGLPTGTYFYIINYKSLDGNNVLQDNKQDGYLYLSR